MNQKKQPSKRRQGTTNQGHSYETDLLILYRIIGERDTDKFFLDSNVDGFGAFDDLVYRYWNKQKSELIFFQQYHTECIEKHKITNNHFKLKKSKFYLGKYFLDHLEIERELNKKPDNLVLEGNFQVKYIFYTNAVLHDRFNESSVTNVKNSILSTRSENDPKDVAFKLKLDNGENSDLISMLANLACQERVGTLTNVNDEDKASAEEFLNKLEIFTGQANHEDLQKIIKRELKNLYKLTEEEVEENFLKIKEKAEKQQSEGKFYLDEGDNFFTEIFRIHIQFDLKDTVDSFQERTIELNDLHSKLQPDSERSTATSRIVSISGLGGMGKTQLARRYARQHKDDYDGNFIWINAESYQTLAESFSKLAFIKLGINLPAGEHQNEIKYIVDEVYAFFSKRKCLFIFDNAQKNEELRNFLPLTVGYDKKIYVLMTSRIVRNEWEEWGVEKGIHLDMFTDEQAISFVKKALKIDEEDVSKDDDIRNLVVDVLYKFPLALGQAVAYIQQESEKSKRRGTDMYTIEKYIENYEIQKKKLLKSDAFRRLDNDYEKTTFTTWTVTIDKIKSDEEHGKLAFEIYNMIAYFAPKNIAVKKFFFKLKQNQDEDNFWESIELLHRYSMITLDDGLADVHQLVQLVTRINLEDEKREEETLKKALESIKDSGLENKTQSECKCIFYPCTPAGGLSNVEVHAEYIWSYAAKYSQLSKDFYIGYGKNGNKPLNLFAITGRIEALKSLLENNDELIAKVNEYNQANYAPIHSAAFNGHKDVVEYLIDIQGVDVNFGTNYSQNTPTYVATLGNQLYLVKYLIDEKQANPNLGGRFDTYPLHLAALYARMDFIEFLVGKNANILALDREDFSVLHHAICHLNVCNDHTSEVEGIIDFFLQMNGDLAKHKNSMEMTPLHFAAEFNSNRIVQMLLNKGADVNAKSHLSEVIHETVNKNECVTRGVTRHPKGYDKGYTPLHIAAFSNHLQNVKDFLKHGAMFDVLNDNHRTPFDLSVMESDVEKFLRIIHKSFEATAKGKKNKLNSLLKDKNSDELEAILNARNCAGQTLMAIAGAKSDKEILMLLIEKFKSIQFSD